MWFCGQKTVIRMPAGIDTLRIALFAAKAFAAQRALDLSPMGGVPLSLTGYLTLPEDSGGALTLDEVQTPALASHFKGAAPSDPWPPRVLEVVNQYGRNCFLRNRQSVRLHGGTQAFIPRSRHCDVREIPFFLWA